MSAETNKAIARGLYEQVLAGKAGHLIEQYVAEDLIDHNARRLGFGGGRSGFAQHVAYFAAVFPQATVTVDDLIAEGDRVIVFWSLAGAQKGEIWGVAPTGKHVTCSTISLLKFRDGQLVEYESRPDRLTLLVQLGSLGNYAQHFDTHRPRQDRG